MSTQRKLFAIPRHPSATAAATRARRKAARLWAALLPTFAPDEQACRNCDEIGKHNPGGALVPTFHGELALCWDCTPSPGNPVRNWETWCPPGMGFDNAPCIRCGRMLGWGAGLGGGTYSRGGPLCWDCKSPSLEEQRAWVLALRADPHRVPPWAGDRAPPFAPWAKSPVTCS